MKLFSVVLLTGFVCIAANSYALMRLGQYIFDSLTKHSEGPEEFIQFMNCFYRVIGQSVANDEAQKEVFDKEKAIVDKLITEWKKCENDKCYSKVYAEIYGSYIRLVEHMGDINHDFAVDTVREVNVKCDAAAPASGEYEASMNPTIE